MSQLFYVDINICMYMCSSLSLCVYIYIHMILYACHAVTFLYIRWCALGWRSRTGAMLLPVYQSPSHILSHCCKAWCIESCARLAHGKCHLCGFTFLTLLLVPAPALARSDGKVVAWGDVLCGGEVGSARDRQLGDGVSGSGGRAPCGWRCSQLGRGAVRP